MNFDLLNREELEEIKSTAFVYRHRSGAKLIHIKNDDENKVFSATFKTPTQNDKGIPHIIEHCLFCGSKNFPSKDPFNELSKGSLNTYLNAMTFRDKTMYPVASCNEEDFLNLMTVYLDAVFEPLMIERSEAFLQEGVNIQIENDMKVGYGGIVYNEMRGVYSDPIENLKNCIYKHLFPETQNAFDAGGIPESIETLTYDEILKFYEEKYTPCNCTIYLFGDLNIENAMAIIDKYISKFKYNENNISIDIQEGFTERKIANVEYESSKNESEKFLSMSYVTGRLHDNKMIMAISLLKCYFFGLETSPLKESLIRNKMCKQIIDSFDCSIVQPVFSIILKDTDKDIDEMQRLVENVFKETLKSGFNENILEACINRIEFAMREEVYGRRPRGLVYNIEIVSDWVNSSESFEKLKKLKYIEEIKNDKDYLLFVIENYFLNNKHSVCISMKPAVEKRKMYEITEATETELEQIEKLKKYIKIEDTREDVEKIPLINVKDIKLKRGFIEPIEKKAGNIRIVHTDLETNDILHTMFLFDTRELSVEYIPYLGILRELLGKLETENLCCEKIGTDLNNHLGGFGAGFKIFVNGKSETYRPKFVIKMKVLKEKSRKMFELAKEVLNSKFSNKEKIEQVLNNLISKQKRHFINNGQELGISIVKANLYEEYKYQDLLQGYEFYEFLKNLMEDYDSKFEKLEEGLKYVASKIFTMKNLTLNICCNEKNYNDTAVQIEEFGSNVDDIGTDCVAEKVRLQFKDTGLTRAFAIESKIQYVVSSVRFDKSEFAYSGSMQVAFSILNKEYLMKEVRIKGGAYGVSAVILKNGLMYIYSYRDPALEKTIDIFDKIGEFLTNFECDEREIEKYILGTINKYNRQLNIVEKNEFAVQNYFTETTETEFLNIQQEILNTDLKQINDIGKNISIMKKEKSLCVLGNKEKIKSFFPEFTTV